jgi:hypothetical protein
MEKIKIPQASGDPKEYTSAGFMTQETLLFSYVFNAFVFMQVFN